jgi:multimeric flavodoxin WrbA
MRIVIINGSLGGANGNTARLLASFQTHLTSTDVKVFHLSDVAPTIDDLVSADAFVFTTGVYWDSWGSPLQAFLEKATPLEGAPCWFGKPAAVIVTMHSVGGKEVLSRLQGVLNTFGLFIPPMSAMAYSLANQMALRNGSPQISDHFERDLWCLDDLTAVAKNLQLAAQNRIDLKTNWSAWPVDRADPKRIWLEDVSR